MPTTPRAKLGSYRALTKLVLNAEKQRQKRKLTPLDDLFSTEESRTNARREHIVESRDGAVPLQKPPF